MKWKANGLWLGLSLLAACGTKTSTTPRDAAPNLEGGTFPSDANPPMDSSGPTGNRDAGIVPDASLGDLDGSMSASGEVCATSSNLPTGWSEVDVGSPAAGNTSIEGCSWTISGGGILHDVASDDFHFVSRSAIGVRSLRVRIDTLTPGSNGSGQVGILFREDASPGGRYVYLLWDNETGSFVLERSVRPRVNIVPTASYMTAPALPYWLRIDFDGAQYGFFGSPDGSTWTEFGQPYAFCACEEGMLRTPQVGMAVTSQTNGSEVATARFGRVILIRD